MPAYLGGTRQKLHIGGQPVGRVYAGTTLVYDSNPAAGTQVNVDDTSIGTADLQWEYGGSWQVNSSEHYTSTAGANATLRFTGTSFVLRGTKDAHHGQIGVSIDGGASVTVDCYATTRQIDSALLDSGTLTDGPHTVVVTALGTKNASSGGTVVAIDRAVVQSTAGTSAPAATWTGIPRLSVQGADMVTPDGQKVLLYGANTMDGEYQADVQSRWDLEDAYIRHLGADWLTNCIMRGFATAPVTAGDAAYLGRLDQLVLAAEESGQYITLAPRSSAINGSQFVGVPPQEALDALGALGARYKDRSHVMYAAQVETNGLPSGYPGLWSEIKPYYVAAVDAVHAAAAPHKPIVMTSGVAYGRTVNGAVADPILRDNVVYKSHPYGPSSSFQGWFGDAVDAGLCVFIGEFAVEGTVPMTQADVDALISYMGSKGLSGTFWIGSHTTPESVFVQSTVPYGVNSRGTPLRAWTRTVPAIPAPLATA